MNKPKWDKWRLEHKNKKFDFNEWGLAYNKFMYVDEGYKYENMSGLEIENLINKKPLSVEKYLNGSKILDVGCGYGLYTMQFANKYPNKNFTGIDIADKVIKQANIMKHIVGLNNVIFQQMSAEKIRCLSNNFDTVMCYEVLEHVQNLDVVLTELFRVLKNGGNFVGSVPRLEIKPGGLHFRFFTFKSLINTLGKYGKILYMGLRDNTRCLFVINKEK